MEIEVTLLNFSILPKYRVYAFSIGTIGGVSEKLESEAPSLFLISYIDGRKFLDILYLRVPIKWAWGKLVDFIA